MPEIGYDSLFFASDPFSYKRSAIVSRNENKQRFETATGTPRPPYLLPKDRLNCFVAEYSSLVRVALLPVLNEQNTCQHGVNEVSHLGEWESGRVGGWGGGSNSTICMMSVLGCGQKRGAVV